MTFLGSWRKSLDSEESIDKIKRQQLRESIGFCSITYVLGPTFSFFFTSSSFLTFECQNSSWMLYIVFSFSYISFLNYLIRSHGIGFHLFISPKWISPGQMLLSSSYNSQLLQYFLFDVPQTFASQHVRTCPPHTTTTFVLLPYFFISTHPISHR